MDDDQEDQRRKLQELLLTQIARKYGAKDFAKLSSVLLQHPLLTSQNAATPIWDETACRMAFDRILKHDTIEQKSREAKDEGSLVARIWDGLYPSYISSLKRGIKELEEQYETEKALNGKSSLAVTEAQLIRANEIPSSTQDTAEDGLGLVEKVPSNASPEVEGKSTSVSHGTSNAVAVSPSSSHHEDDNKGLAKQQENAGSKVETGDVDMMDASPAVEPVASAVNASAYGTVNTDEVAQQEDDIQALLPHDQNASSMNEPNDISTAVIKGEQNQLSSAIGTAESQDPRLPEEVVDNGVTEEAPTEPENVAKTNSIATSLQATPVSESPVVIPRTTRTRSSTMNTVISNDANATDEPEPTPVVKRRAGRPGKRKVVKEEDVVKSPEAPSADDAELDAAAALKRFQGMMASVLNSITSHRCASIFASRVSDRDAPNYSKVVKYPLDLKTIRAQVKSGEIRNVKTFYKVVLLMFSNAIMYNPEKSEVAAMAMELLHHVEEAISLFWASEEFGDASDDRTPKRRRRND